MIDLHCHLLPGVDDGPASLDESLALARAAAAAGTRTIVVTPHIDRRWGVAPEAVPAAVERLAADLVVAHVELEVLPGGEVELGRLADMSPAQLGCVRLGGGPYVLLESPHSSAGDNFAHTVERLLAGGERLVLAHPERCPEFLRRPERLDRLVAAGAVCSVTASALLGRFGREVRELAIRMLGGGLAHNVASDGHDATNRSPELLAGLHAAERELPGALTLADWLTCEVPKAVLAGAPLPDRPELAPPRRRRRLRLARRD